MGHARLLKFLFLFLKKRMTDYCLVEHCTRKHLLRSSYCVKHACMYYEKNQITGTYEQCTMQKVGTRYCALHSRSCDQMYTSYKASCNITGSCTNSKHLSLGQGLQEIKDDKIKSLAEKDMNTWRNYANRFDTCASSRENMQEQCYHDDADSGHKHVIYSMKHNYHDCSALLAHAEQNYDEALEHHTAALELIKQSRNLHDSKIMMNKIEESFSNPNHYNAKTMLEKKIKKQSNRKQKRNETVLFSVDEEELALCELFIYFVSCLPSRFLASAALVAIYRACPKLFQQHKLVFQSMLELAHKEFINKLILLVISHSTNDLLLFQCAISMYKHMQIAATKFETFILHVLPLHTRTITDLCNFISDSVHDAIVALTTSNRDVLPVFQGLQTWMQFESVTLLLNEWYKTNKLEPCFVVSFTALSCMMLMNDNRSALQTMRFMSDLFTIDQEVKQVFHATQKDEYTMRNLCCNFFKRTNIKSERIMYEYYRKHTMTPHHDDYSALETFCNNSTILQLFKSNTETFAAVHNMSQTVKETNHVQQDMIQSFIYSKHLLMFYTLDSDPDITNMVKLFTMFEIRNLKKLMYSVTSQDTNLELVYAPRIIQLIKQHCELLWYTFGHMYSKSNSIVHVIETSVSLILRFNMHNPVMTELQLYVQLLKHNYLKPVAARPEFVKYQFFIPLIQSKTGILSSLLQEMLPLNEFVNRAATWIYDKSCDVLFELNSTEQPLVKVMVFCSYVVGWKGVQYERQSFAALLEQANSEIVKQSVHPDFVKL